MDNFGKQPEGIERAEAVIAKASKIEGLEKQVAVVAKQVEGLKKGLEGKNTEEAEAFLKQAKVYTELLLGVSKLESGIEQAELAYKNPVVVKKTEKSLKGLADAVGNEMTFTLEEAEEQQKDYSFNPKETVATDYEVAIKPWKVADNLIKAAIDSLPDVPGSPIKESYRRLYEKRREVILSNVGKVIGTAKMKKGDQIKLPALDEFRQNIFAKEVAKYTKLEDGKIPLALLPDGSRYYGDLADLDAAMAKAKAEVKAQAEARFNADSDTVFTGEGGIDPDLKVLIDNDPKLAKKLGLDKKKES